jgi:hypothetical protein
VLAKTGAGTVPIRALRVYRPFWGRSSTTVEDPVAIGRPTVQAAPRDGTVRTAARERSYDLSGRWLATVRASGGRRSGVEVRHNQKTGATHLTVIPR